MAAEPNNNNSSAVALLEQQLVPVLAACLSADQAERAAAEAALKQHEAVPGLIVALLRVAMLERAGGGLDMGVRQVAVIQFKNTVKRRWEASSESASGDAGGDPAAVAPQAATTPPASTPPLAEADRVAVRENLLEALMAAPHAVQVQLGDAFKAIAYCDFPERWPSLLPGIQSALAGAAAAGSGAGADAADPASPAGARMHGALYALRILARKYEFRDEGDRAPLKGIIAGTFPVLLALMQQLLANPTPSPGVAKLVLKVFWSATFMGVPDELLRQEQFAGWLTCLHQALTMPVPGGRERRTSKEEEDGGGEGCLAGREESLSLALVSPPPVALCSRRSRKKKADRPPPPLPSHPPHQRNRTRRPRRRLPSGKPSNGSCTSRTACTAATASRASPARATTAPLRPSLCSTAATSCSRTTSRCWRSWPCPAAARTCPRA